MTDPTAGDLLDVDALAAWARERVPGSGALTVERLAAGHSNLTFVLGRADDERRWVLRRPPLGPLLPTAHDVVREYRVLSLLQGSAARVPRVLDVCPDPSVVGAPFYVMEKVAGDVVRDTVPGWLDDHADRRALGLDLVDALAELHSVPTAPFVAARLGRDGGYVARQLARWRAQREGVQAAVAAAGASARELPDYDAVRDWLEAHQPADTRSAVVHGDYKLDNVLVAHGDGPPRVAAVLDWEMATVGDPLADLGYLLSFWPEPGETTPLAELASAAPGFPSRDDLVARYAARTGTDVPDTTFYVTLAVWKLAILLEASYYRWLAGMSDDPFFGRLETGVPQLLARARERCGA